VIVVCPVCSSGNTEVLETRKVSDGKVDRRRHRCQCGVRWTSRSIVEPGSIVHATGSVGDCSTRATGSVEDSGPHATGSVKPPTGSVGGVGGGLSSGPGLSLSSSLGDPDLLLEASVTPIAHARSTKGSKKYTPTAYPEAFEAEWAQTGKVGSKFDAKIAWDRLGRPAFGESWARWMQTDQWQRGFVPHVSTWLNDRRFEQEPVQGQRPAVSTRQSAAVEAGRRFIERRQKENG
jgi:hypothetical protein